MEKLVNSELKIMKVLWSRGDTTAKEISDILGKEIGWNINTTYTLIRRCMKKGAIERREPNFLCHALIEEEVVVGAETEEFVENFYDGSMDKLFAAIIGKVSLNEEQLERLRSIIEEKKD